MVWWMRKCFSSWRTEPVASRNCWWATGFHARFVYATRSHVPDLMVTRHPDEGQWVVLRILKDARGSVRVVVPQEITALRVLEAMQDQGRPIPIPHVFGTNTAIHDHLRRRRPPPSPWHMWSARDATIHDHLRRRRPPPALSVAYAPAC